MGPLTAPNQSDLLMDVGLVDLMFLGSLRSSVSTALYAVRNCTSLQCGDHEE